tara:strand:+ start:13116 stop:13433 length:318 start_codon:yes stop_codon:yes gene_type:complete
MAQDVCWFRRALKAHRIEPCIPPKSTRKTEIPLGRVLYKSRHKIENMFVKLKDCGRIHTRYHRCAPAFMSAIAIATTVIFWISQCVLSLANALLRQNRKCKPKLA